jgi:hypothetical protein
MFTHMVFFWMKEGAPPAEREGVIKSCNELLAKIPTVKHLWAGKPAMTPRDVVDNSYDVGLCVVMDDRAGHDVYQNHPLHTEFINRHKLHWQRVRVYDFM